MEQPKVGVGVIVIKKEGQKQFVMLHQRKGKLGTHYWGSGGGHVEPGESLQEAIMRELREEAGDDLKVTNVSFLGVYNFTEMPPKHYVDISFYAEYVSGEPVNNSPEETTEWQWFDVNDVPSPLFPPVEIHLKALKTGEKFFDSHTEVYKPKTVH